jgi:DNA polymerase-3 subunit epsilon
MREIIFDTETTGLDFAADRIIEFGGIELMNRFPTGRTFHVYINPQGRAVHPEALAVHGISDQQLADKPTFDQIAEELCAFLDGASVIAHNASFDIAFLNAELQRLGRILVEQERVVDTLAMARRKHPMGPNSLDALCRRYGIDNSRRTKHGALLDAELLAEVYIELIGGKQAALGLEPVIEKQSGAAIIVEGVTLRQRPAPLSSRLSEAELAAHARLIEKLGPDSVWSRLSSHGSSIQ